MAKEQDPKKIAEENKSLKEQIETTKNRGKSKNLIDSSGNVNTREFAQASQQYKRPAKYK